jgi:hypothetical protein
VQSRFDIIGWDPRGVARSQPVKCSVDRGHGVYRRSECTSTAVDTYLATLKTPMPGARCAAVEPGGAALRGTGAGPVIPGWGR